MKIFTLITSCALLLLTTHMVAQPVTAAPTPPARNAGDVISCFSAAYTDLAGTDWFPNWGQSTVVSEITVAGDVIKKYATFNYQGVQFASSINASSMTKLHLDIWTPNCTAFDVYPIVSGQPEQKVTLTPTLSGWNSFDISLSDYTIPLANIIQFKFVGTPFGTSEVYLDNIYFWKPSNVPTITGFTVPAKVVGDAPFALTAPTSNSSGAFSYTSSNMGVATISGSTVTIVGAGTSIITANQAAASPYVAGSITASLVVTSPGPTTAATTPTALAANVISMFSNAYTNVPIDTWSASWDVADVADVTIAGNDTKKYTNLTYAGIEFTGANLINATSKTHFHMDIWTPDASTFNVKLVDFGANAAYAGGDDTESELSFTPTLSGWYAIDVPLSNFTGLAARAHLAQMIIVGVGGGKTVWVDNVYFYSSAAPSVPTVAATTPTRPSSNVISLFSNAYTDLAGTNWNPNWGQTTVYTEVMIAGNATKKYETLNYQGAEPAAPINATAATFLHLDVWTPTTSNLRVKLVDFGAGGVYGGGDDTEHELSFDPTGGAWVSLDIPLANFTGMAARAHVAQFIISSTSASPTFWIDNIYFYSNTVIPVELTSFKAKTANSTTILNWQTASERDNQGFIIERSTNGTTYNTISQVKGNGTTATVHDYTFTDNTPSVGINYYRLRQTDFNGQETLSPVVSVIFGKNSLVVKSNLVHSTLDVTVGEESPSAIGIYNLSGQQVYTEKVQGTQRIDVSALAAGLYIIRTETGEVSRFVKE